MRRGRICLPGHHLAGGCLDGGNIIPLAGDEMDKMDKGRGTQVLTAVRTLVPLVWSGWSLAREG